MSGYLKWATVQMKTATGNEWAGALINKKLIDETKKALEPTGRELMNLDIILPGDLAELKSALAEPQIVIATEANAPTSPTAFCLSEVRVNLAGSYTVVAIEYAKLPGNDWSSKIAAFEKMTFDDAKVYAAQNGFWLTMQEPGSPPDFRYLGWGGTHLVK